MAHRNESCHVIYEKGVSRALSLLQRDTPREGYLSVIEIGLVTLIYEKGVSRALSLLQRDTPRGLLQRDRALL